MPPATDWMYFRELMRPSEADPSTAETFRKYAVFVFVGQG